MTRPETGQPETNTAFNFVTREGISVTAHFDVLDCPLALQMPQRLTDVISWHPHIPLAFVLMQLLRPKRVVELGTHKGDSYCAFCQAVDALDLDTACYAVDTWEGDEQAGYYGAEVLAELRAYHDPRYGRFSTLIQGLFDDALDRFDDQTIDLLHIDGLHTYEAVKHDFETWLPKMTCRGVVLLHDVNEHQTDFGVWQVWHELEHHYPHCTFRYGHGLGIIAVGDEGATLLQDFFTAVQCNPDLLRYYALLGERIELYRDRQGRNAERDVELAAVQAALTKRDAEVQRLTTARRELEAWAMDLEAKVKDQQGHMVLLTERITFLTEHETELRQLLAAAHDRRFTQDCDDHSLLVTLGRGIEEHARQIGVLTAEKGVLTAEKDAYAWETNRYVAHLEQSWREKNAHIALLEAMVQPVHRSFFARVVRRIRRESEK